VRLPVGVSLAELSAPLPVGAGTPSQLLPTFDAGSRAAVFGAIARRAVPLELVFRPGFYGIE
jgi:hypothetical protein